MKIRVGTGVAALAVLLVTMVNGVAQETRLHPKLDQKLAELRTRLAKKKTGFDFFDLVKRDAPLRPEYANVAWLDYPGVENIRKVLAAEDEKRGRELAYKARKHRDPKQIDPELSKFGNEFTELKDANEVEAWLTRWEPKADSKDSSPDLRFALSQALLMRPLRGVVWKLIPILQTRESRVAHSMILTMIEKLTSGLAVFYEDRKEYRALFDYFTQPYVENGAICAQVPHEAALQAFLAGTYLQALDKADRRIRALDFSEHEVAWDNRFTYGSADYKDSLDQYRLVGEVERRMTLASIRAAMFQISAMRAYNVEGVLRLFAELGGLHGMDGFLLGDVVGTSAEIRAKVYTSPAFAMVDRILPDGEQWMHYAFANLRETILQTNVAWQYAQSRENSEIFMIDPTFFKAGARLNSAALANLVEMTKGAFPIRSAVVQGTTFTVNLPEFYTHPPKDLKQLQAYAWEGGEEWLPIELKVGNSTVTKEYRNYFKGRGNAWHMDQFHSFLPDLKSDADLPRALRTLAQSWGGVLVSYPLSEFVD
jgi:hypothetical protein